MTNKITSLCKLTRLLKVFRPIGEALHVRPRIGQMRLADIKIHDVQTVYAEMEAGGSSARTVRGAHTVLSMAMKKAVQLDYIVKNPCYYAELPKQVKDGNCSNFKD